jgi:hypothetical protein
VVAVVRRTTPTRFDKSSRTQESPGMGTVNTGSQFDAHLMDEGTMNSAANAKLKLILKVNFQQVTFFGTESVDAGCQFLL